MMINALINRSVHCARCGAAGFMTCACWKECACGLIVGAGETCGHPVHGEIGKRMLRAGYWLIDENTGRPYKSRTNSVSWLRKRLDTGSAWGSRREANAALGKQGGKKRSKNLTPEQRSEIARKAGKAGGRGRKKEE